MVGPCDGVCAVGSVGDTDGEDVIGYVGRRVGCGVEIGSHGRDPIVGLGVCEPPYGGAVSPMVGVYGEVMGVLI
jgi:hypothetical protein